MCKLAYDTVEEHRHLFRRLAVFAIQPFPYYRISALIEEKAKFVPFFLCKGFGNRHILSFRAGAKSKFAAVPKEKIEACISEIQEELEVELDPLQREAVEMALCNQVSVLTGGAGCGKTTILRFIIGVMEKLSKLHHFAGCDIALAAPTGMAAKRMMAATGKEAKAIHKLIEYNPALPALTLNEGNPLPYDFVIVDELSCSRFKLDGYRALLSVRFTSMALAACR